MPPVPFAMTLRLLCITAHPDDEAGGFGGVLRLYAERGVEAAVICLTPGQAASHRGGIISDEELAAARRREFAASCGLLKVAHAEVLDYRDGALERADFHAVVGDLTARVRRLRPHVMVTFGSDGAITAHPDHGMAGLFATMAFQWAGRDNRFVEQLRNGLRPYRPQKLYYATAPFTLPDRQPVALAPATAIIDIGEYLDTKIAAFRQHTTQSPLFPLFEGNVRKRGAEERFHLVACAVPSVVKMESDLFEGVEE
jgi:LmbE family N-acetylglucosaminyl deacetylase